MRSQGKPFMGPTRRKGAIDYVIVDKTNGEIAYAVLSFGGFLRLGADHYPVP
jgi:hypothetical protein